MSKFSLRNCLMTNEYAATLPPVYWTPWRQITEPVQLVDLTGTLDPQRLKQHMKASLRSDPNNGKTSTPDR